MEADVPQRSLVMMAIAMCLQHLLMSTMTPMFACFQVILKSFNVLSASFAISQISIPILSQTMIPQSANSKYKPLKRLGEGKDGDVVLAVPRVGVQDLGSCIALKILKDGKTTTMARKMLERLKHLQHNEDHLIAAIRDYQDNELPEWHCMSYIPGCSIQKLLETTYSEHGMPPTVVCHVLAELVRVQGHLRDHSLTHIDLGAGGNVMLSNKNGDAWPSVTLVDFSGVYPYNQRREVEHVFRLIKRMTKNLEAVPECWISSSFPQQEVLAAGMIYEMICGWETWVKDGEHLAGVWSLWSKRILQSKQSLKDDVALQTLREELDTARITEKDVERMIETPELVMEVLRFDAVS
jgi:hypothetical protein